MVVPQPKLCPGGNDQVTSCEGLLVPATVAVKLCVPPRATETAAGLIVTEVTVGIPVTVTVAASHTLELAVEVARTLTLVAVTPAPIVRTPLELMVTPVGHPSTDQVTLCEGLLVPATVAVKVCVPPRATETAAGLIVTEVTMGIPGTTVTVASPHQPLLTVEVARTIMLGAVELTSTVRTPPELMAVFPRPCCPDGIDQETELPLNPLVVAVKVCVPPLTTEAAAGLTVTGCSGTTTVASPHIRRLAVEVARTVMLVAVAPEPTMRDPPELMLVVPRPGCPSGSDQVTSCSAVGKGLAVPATSAVKVRLPPLAT